MKASQKFAQDELLKILIELQDVTKLVLSSVTENIDPGFFDRIESRLKCIGDDSAHAGEELRRRNRAELIDDLFANTPPSEDEISRAMMSGQWSNAVQIYRRRTNTTNAIAAMVLQKVPAIAEYMGALEF